MTSTLHLIDASGDTRVEWDPRNPEEVKLAKDAFDKAQKNKMLVYKTRADGSQAELMRTWDPQAERILCTRQTVGG